MALSPPKRARRPPPFSAPPPPYKSEPELDDVPATYTTKNGVIIKEMDFDPYQPLTREEMKVLDNLIDISEDTDEVFKKERVDDFVKRKRKERVNHGNRIVIVDHDEIFDANRSSKCHDLPKPVHFKNNPSEFRKLTKCATLAIGDYNLQTQTNYQFVDIEMATWLCVAGNLYYITFRARNAEKKYSTFQAIVLTDKKMRTVDHIRMKGSSTWYPGTLSELN